MQAQTTLAASSASTKPETESWVPQSGWRIAGIALLLGVAADILFYKQSLGLSAPIFAALVVVATVYAFAREASARWATCRRNVWLGAPVIFFAAMVFLRDEPFLSFLNIVATLLLLGLMFFTLGTNRLERLTVMAYPLSVAIGGIMAAFSAFPLVGFVLSRLGSRKGNPAGRILLGLMIALPFLVVFGALFSAADAVFAQVMKQVFNLDFLPDLIGQLIWIGFVAWLCAGALMMGISRAHQKDSSPNLEKPIKASVHLGFVESATVLVSVNVLFAVFVAIQFTYLFGGNANIHIDGFTYAEYARRGFFELVAVAVVTMGLLLGLDWLTGREVGRQSTTFKALCLALIALVLVVLLSAFQRMSLYESAYGFTSLRLYTHWFMVWMGVVFGLKALALWLERGQIFAFGWFVSMIVSLMGFNLLNPDAFIAEQNLKRYLETGKLDTAYVIAMSADAAPVVMARFDELKDAEKERIGGGMRYQMDSLYQRLEHAGWQSYHWSRKQAIDALLARRDTLNRYKPLRPYYRID